MHALTCVGLPAAGERATGDRGGVRAPSHAPARAGVLARILGRAVLLGPAFVAAIGYVDPGNYATNIQAGAEYGYELLWVVLWANLLAILVQLLSSKLGLATGLSLAETLRRNLPPWAGWAYWIQAEVLAIATDLAEFVGAALGFTSCSG